MGGRCSCWDLSRSTGERENRYNRFASSSVFSPFSSIDNISNTLVSVHTFAFLRETAPSQSTEDTYWKTTVIESIMVALSAHFASLFLLALATTTLASPVHTVPTFKEVERAWKEGLSEVSFTSPHHTRLTTCPCPPQSSLSSSSSTLPHPLLPLQQPTPAAQPLIPPCQRDIHATTSHPTPAFALRSDGIHDATLTSRIETFAETFLSTHHDMPRKAGPEEFSSSLDERTLQERRNLKENKDKSTAERVKEFVIDYVEGKIVKGGRGRREQVDMAPVLRPRRGRRWNF